MNQNEQYYAEKRDFIRLFIDAPIDFAISGTAQWFQGKGIDLSAGGLSFTTEQALSAGDNIEFKLTPVTPVTPSLEATVSVIRAEKNVDGKYVVSVRIENIVD